MHRTLYAIVSVNGSPTKLLSDPGFPRDIQVSVRTTDAVNRHIAYFGKSRTEMQIPDPDGTSPGFPIPVGPVAGGVTPAIATQTLTRWTGELWGISDIDGVAVDIQEGVKK